MVHARGFRQIASRNIQLKCVESFRRFLSCRRHALQSSLPLLRQLADKLGDLTAHCRDLGDKFLYRHAGDAGSDGRDLQEVVPCYHANGIVGPQIVDDLFDVGIGGLVLLGLDHAIAVAGELRAHTVLDQVGIKHQQQVSLGEGHVVGQQVHEHFAGPLQTEFCFLG